MASSLLLYTQLALCVLLISLTCASRADAAVADHPTELDWTSPAMALYGGVDEIGMEDDDGVIGGATAVGRRSLWWKRMRYYISYGALSANRVACPPRSGRSYYTHRCWRARGPVRPYTRGCSAITRCRR